MLIKTGVCEWSLPVNGSSAVVLAAKAGYDGIQLGDLGGMATGFPMNNKHIQEGYLQAAADHNIVLQSLHPYGLQRQGTMLYPPETPEGQEGIRSISMCIDACVDMCIPSLMVSSFFATMIRSDWEFNVYASHLKYACHLGREKGVTIVYESVLTIPRLLKMIDIVGDDLKICYDIMNPVEFGTGTPKKDIPALGRNRIDHFHVKEAPPDTRGCCLLGEGGGDWKGTVEAIRRIGFEGWLISENSYHSLAAATGRDFMELAAKDAGTIKLSFEEET